jgi:hypothetical protein
LADHRLAAGLRLAAPGPDHGRLADHRLAAGLRLPAPRPDHGRLTNHRLAAGLRLSAPRPDHGRLTNHGLAAGLRLSAPRLHHDRRGLRLQVGLHVLFQNVGLGCRLHGPGLHLGKRLRLHILHRRGVLRLRSAARRGFFRHWCWPPFCGACLDFSSAGASSGVSCARDDELPSLLAIAPARAVSEGGGPLRQGERRQHGAREHSVTMRLQQTDDVGERRGQDVLLNSCGNGDMRWIGLGVYCGWTLLAHTFFSVLCVAAVRAML